MLTPMDKRLRRLQDMGKLDSTMRVATVRVRGQSPTGYVTINEADFDPEQHEIFEGASSGASANDADSDLSHLRGDLKALPVTELDEIIEEEGLDVDLKLKKADKIDAMVDAMAKALAEE